MGKKKDMRAAMTRVIQTRLEWGDGETFPWKDAYGGEAYTHEAEVEEVDAEAGRMTLTIPVSISMDDEADTWVQVELQVTVNEIIEG